MHQQEDDLNFTEVAILLKNTKQFSRYGQSKICDPNPKKMKHFDEVESTNCSSMA